MRLKFNLKGCNIRVPGIGDPRELKTYSLGSLQQLFVASDPAGIKCRYLPMRAITQIKIRQSLCNRSGLRTSEA